MYRLLPEVSLRPGVNERHVSTFGNSIRLRRVVHGRMSSSYALTKMPVELVAGN